MNDFETRFPPDKMKQLGHANKFAGGFDKKYEK